MMLRWNAEHPCCQHCQTVKTQRFARGLCRTCYKRASKTDTLPPLVEAWSKTAPACVECGTTKLKHCGQGLCRNCYSRAYNRTEQGRAIALRTRAKWAQTDHGRAVLDYHSRKWGENNPEKVRQASRRTRERKYGIDVPIPLGYEKLVLETFGNQCASCCAKDPVVLDHHQPLRDGNCLLHNAVPLCRSCNCKKHRQRPEAFYGPDRLFMIEYLLARLRERFDEVYGATEAA